MALGTVKLGNVSVGRMIVGGNPFSGFSHQGEQCDAAMKHWFSAERIKQALRQAEGLGVTAHLSRADHHVKRYMLDIS